ncbi:MAG: TolC family outer membrane protein [Thermodesulfobacteriota bacterium]
MNKWFKRSSAIVAGGVLLFGGNVLQAETLPEAVELVLKDNPQIQTASFNYQARQHEVRQARSDYWPRVDFSAGVGIYEIQEPEMDPDSYDPQEMTLSARWNLFAGGQTMNEVDRQQARVISSSYDLQATADRLALRTTKVYLDVLRHDALHNLAQENLLTHQRISDQIGLRSDSGVASQADSDQVRGRVSLAQSNVVVTKTNLIDAHSNYLAVVGHLPENLMQIGSPGAVPASMEDAVMVAKTNHPGVKAAEADLEARREQDSVAKSPFFPVIDVEVDKNWDEDVDGIEGKQENLTAMLRLRYNLFHGFRDKARKNETTLLISEAQEIKNNTVNQVEESVRLSWMAYQAVMDRMEYLQAHVRSSTSTLDAYKKQFDLGKRTLLDVLDTEAEVIDAKKDLVNATYDGLYAQFRVLNGTGSLVPSMGLEWPEGVIVEEAVEQVAEVQE